MSEPLGVRPCPSHTALEDCRLLALSVMDVTSLLNDPRKPSPDLRSTPSPKDVSYPDKFSLPPFAAAQSLSPRIRSAPLRRTTIEKREPLYSRRKLGFHPPRRRSVSRDSVPRSSPAFNRGSLERAKIEQLDTSADLRFILEYGDGSRPQARTWKSVDRGDDDRDASELAQLYVQFHLSRAFKACLSIYGHH